MDIEKQLDDYKKICEEKSQIEKEKNEITLKLIEFEKIIKIENQKNNEKTELLEKNRIHLNELQIQIENVKPDKIFSKKTKYRKRTRNLFKRIRRNTK